MRQGRRWPTDARFDPIEVDTCRMVGFLERLCMVFPMGAEWWRGENGISVENEAVRPVLIRRRIYKPIINIK